MAVEDIGIKVIATEATTEADDDVNNTTVVDSAVEGHDPDMVHVEEDVPVLEAPSRAVTAAPLSSKGKSPVGRLMGFTPWKAVKGFGAAVHNVHWRSSMVL